MPFHLKMAGASSTADARVKVPLFQKVTFFLKYSTETALIKDKHTSNDLF